MNKPMNLSSYSDAVTALALIGSVLETLDFMEETMINISDNDIKDIQSAKELLRRVDVGMLQECEEYQEKYVEFK